jgi:pyridoxal phosphate enzyme (YggS family)
VTAAAPGRDDYQSRRGELARNLAGITARVAAACAAAGRDESEITLIAVTKTRPASDVLALASLGLTDFGENRDQEAAAKAAEAAQMIASTPTGPPDPPINWHFIGQLQTNKAASVAGYARVVHSVDRVRLVRALGAAARQARAGPAGRSLSCLVQVSLDGDRARGGVPVAAFSQVADAIENEEGLTLGGVMAVAPLGGPAEEAFVPLRALSARARAVNPAATMISAGMSGDLEAAVRFGATHLRIGTALLGNRRPPVL